MAKPNVIQRPAVVGNYKIGRSSPISQITFHHIVGDAPAAIARFQTPGVQVSSTYVIGKDGTIYQMVADGNTPYTDNNSASNARSITIEHAGGHPSVPYTEAMYQASIRLVRWLMEAYGINSFKRHREVGSAPTACPGGLDVERIVRDAKGGNMSDIADFNFVNDVAVGMTGLEAKTNPNFMNNVGAPKSVVVRNFINYTEAKNFRNKASSYDKDVAAAGGEAKKKLDQIKQIANS